MNQTIQCPICGKEGIPDFHKEDVVCPCCGSDLSIYNRLREVTEIHTNNSRDAHRNNRLWVVLSSVVIIILIAFSCLTQYKSTLKQASLNQKETEITELKTEISLLQDSVYAMNRILMQTNSIVTANETDMVDYRLYIVKRGDCFRRISCKQLGTEQRFEEIATLNHLASDAIIHPGDTLRIPNK